MINFSQLRKIGYFGYSVHSFWHSLWQLNVLQESNVFSVGWCEGADQAWQTLHWQQCLQAALQGAFAKKKDVKLSDPGDLHHPAHRLDSGHRKAIHGFVLNFNCSLMYCVDVCWCSEKKRQIWNKFTQATQLTALWGTACPPTWWTPTVGSIPLSRNQSLKHFEQNQHTFLWIIDVCFVGWRAKWWPRLAKMLHTLELPPRMATRRISSEPQHNSHPSLFPRKSIVSLSTLF